MKLRIITLHQLAILLLIGALTALSLGYWQQRNLISQQRQELRDNQHDIEGFVINLSEAHETMDKMEAERDALKARFCEARFCVENIERGIVAPVATSGETERFTAVKLVSPGRTIHHMQDEGTPLAP